MQENSYDEQSIPTSSLCEALSTHLSTQATRVNFLGQGGIEKNWFVDVEIRMGIIRTIKSNENTNNQTSVLPMSYHNYLIWSGYGSMCWLDEGHAHQRCGKAWFPPARHKWHPVKVQYSHLENCKTSNYERFIDLEMPFRPHMTSEFTYIPSYLDGASSMDGITLSWMTWSPASQQIDDVSNMASSLPCKWCLSP